MSLGHDGQFDDVLKDYVAERLTVGTTQVEAKVGVSRNANRQIVFIFNDSDQNVYYGPTGVTASGGFGIPIGPGQGTPITVGDTAVYLIAA